MGELLIGQSIKGNFRLWRYMSLDKLINLLSTQTLYFTPLLYYQTTDPFEGYRPKVALKALAEMAAKGTQQIEKVSLQLKNMYEEFKKVKGIDPDAEQRLKKIESFIDGPYCFPCMCSPSGGISTKN